MNILELDTYDLGDAVKFNDQLNPRLFDSSEHLRPEVRDQLMRIAERNTPMRKTIAKKRASPNEPMNHQPDILPPRFLPQSRSLAFHLVFIAT